MRFKVQHFFTGNNFTIYSVFFTSLKNVLQARNFFVIQSDNNFAAQLKIDSLFKAELLHCFCPVCTGPLSKTRFVVYATMQHTGIVTGLMGSKRIFFFNDRNFLIWDVLKVEKRWPVPQYLHQRCKNQT